MLEVAEEGLRQLQVEQHLVTAEVDALDAVPAGADQPRQPGADAEPDGAGRFPGEDLQHCAVVGGHHHRARAVDAKAVAGVEDEIPRVAVTGEPHAARCTGHEGADAFRKHRRGVAFEAHLAGG